MPLSHHSTFSARKPKPSRLKNKKNYSAANAKLVIGGAQQSDAVCLAGTTGCARFKGDIAAVLTYSRALTTAEIERNCDDMGDRFAEEAIRMNRGEARARGIYGNPSEDDREALADEGIAVMQIPWLKPAES